jgi:thiamine pyrophosphate-dependent acetolactate synthase large subunit-like protein
MQDVLKEKYPDKAAAISNNPLPAVNDMPEDVIDEALKRYYANKKLVVGPRIQIRPTGSSPKQEIKRTVTYV